jgi:5-methylcytosine-specific restriction protein A
VDKRNPGGKNLQSKQARNPRSDEALAYRKLYGTARWKRLRTQQLRNHPTCRHCHKSQRVTAATVADHVKPHRGDLALFFDPLNLQSLCDTCHSGAKQAEERRGTTPGCDANGTPLDTTSHWHATARGDRG